MKYSQLKQVLQEVLTPDQKKKVDTWNKGDNSFSDHMFKDNEHRQSFELENPRKSDHEDVVSKHLEPHGFSIKDYKSGTAIDKHGRETTIGKALNKVKAPSEVATKFQNDPHRQQKGAENLHVSLSRHHHDVAGMTSEGQSWKDESCMNFCTGSNRYYLPHDVAHGTHIAYLTDKDDHDNSRPLARIALKKHTNIDDPNDHILVPEHRTYGSAPSTFDHTVHRILEKHQPNMDNGIYKKNENVYNDSKVTYHVGKNKIDEALNHHNDDIVKSVSHSNHFQDHHINKILDHVDKFSDKNIQSAITKTDVSSKTLDKIQDGNYGSDIRSAAASHRNAQDHHLDKALEDPNLYVRATAALNHNAKDRHIDKALKDGYSVKAMVAKNPNLKEHHIDKLVNDDSPIVKEAISKHKNLNSYHVDKLVDSNDKLAHKSLLDHNSKKLNADHVKKMLSSKFYPIIEKAAKHPSLKESHINDILKDDSVSDDVKKSVFSNENTTAETVEKHVNDSKFKTNALIHKKLPNDIMEKHLNGGSSNEKNIILSGNPNIKDHHIEKVLKGDDSTAIMGMSMNPVLKKHHLEHIVNDERHNDVIKGIAKDRLDKDNYSDK